MQHSRSPTIVRLSAPPPLVCTCPTLQYLHVVSQQLIGQLCGKAWLRCLSPKSDDAYICGGPGRDRHDQQVSCLPRLRGFRGDPPELNRLGPLCSAAQFRLELTGAFKSKSFRGLQSASTVSLATVSQQGLLSQDFLRGR